MIIRGIKPKMKTKIKLRKMQPRRPSGQVFLLSVMILSAVLIAGLMLMSIFTKDLRLATETSRSVEAFYAADSAMEWQLYQTFVGTINPPQSPFPSNGAKCCLPDLYENTYNEETGTGIIRTIGVSGKVKRGIEVYL